jgi:hypothetical protein
LAFIVHHQLYDGVVCGAVSLINDWLIFTKYDWFYVVGTRAFKHHTMTHPQSRRRSLMKTGDSVPCFWIVMWLIDCGIKTLLMKPDSGEFSASFLTYVINKLLI